MTLVFTLEPAFFTVMQLGWLSGYANHNGNTALRVPYRNWPDEFDAEYGTRALDFMLRNHPNTEIVVFGHSEGSQVACKWLREYAPTTSVDPAKVSFLLTGNPERRYGGAIGMMTQANGIQSPGWTGGVWFPPSLSATAYANGYLPGIPLDTPFTVTDIARQYDHYADYPSSSTSVTPQAGQNASTSIHMNYFNVSVNDANLVSHTEGNITWKWSPTYPCPSATHSTDPATMLANDRAVRPGFEACYQRPVTLPTP